MKTHQTKNNYSNKGMTLEHDIEKSNLFYLTEKIACIYKKPTPVQIVKVEFPARNKAKIVEAYYRSASTTDYNGVFQGHYIDFDAKEFSGATSFPLKNIEPHQIKHLNECSFHGGITFLIVAWKKYGEYYLIPWKVINEIILSQERQSLSYQLFKEKAYLIKEGFNPRLDYLKIVAEHLIEDK
jgi:recombination protein U